jgi:hypothetical protein
MCCVVAEFGSELVLVLRGVCAMTRRKPWSVEEERRMKELLESGSNARQVAVSLGKSFEGVRQKMFRLGLREKSLPELAHSGSSNLPVSRLLPTLEEALIDLYDAIRGLKQPGLSEADVERLRSVILGIKVYKECYVELRRFREAEDRIMELTKQLDACDGENVAEAKEDESGVGPA